MAKVIIKSEKITPYGGICYASKVFSRLLNLNPQWGKGRCVLFFTSLDFYRADIRISTMFVIHLSSYSEVLHQKVTCNPF